MYMANTRNLRLGPNATYIPLTWVGGFAFGDTKNLRHSRQEISTCWYFFALGNTKVLSFALGDAKVPNVNGFVSLFFFFLLNHHRGNPPGLPDNVLINTTLIRLLLWYLSMII